MSSASGSWTVWSWRCRHHHRSKRPELLAQRHSVTRRLESSTVLLWEPQISQFSSLPDTCKYCEFCRVFLCYNWGDLLGLFSRYWYCLYLMVSVSTVLGRGRKVYALTWYGVICSHTAVSLWNLEFILLVLIALGWCFSSGCREFITQLL